MTDTNSKFWLKDGSLSRELREAFGITAGYQAIWKRHADGAIQLRREPGRSTGLHALAADLPLIAAALGYESSEKIL